jgi:hypothetical protein
MTEIQQPTVKKKIYTKPQLTEVRLAAQEAVLGFCKLADGVQSVCVGDNICIETQGS